jgi:hypothetical protein
VRGQFNALARDYFSDFAAADIVLAKLYPVSGLVGGLAIADLARQQNRS